MKNDNMKWWIIKALFVFIFEKSSVFTQSEYIWLYIQSVNNSMPNIALEFEW